MSIHNSNRIKLGTTHKWLSYLIWLVVAISGVVYTFRQDYLLVEPDSTSVNILKIHGLFAAVTLIIFGSIIGTHIHSAWQRKRNVVTGVLIFSMFSIVSLSGYALYYSPEEWHEFAKWTHIYSGILTILILPAHIAIGRFLQRQRIKLHRKHQN